MGSSSVRDFATETKYVMEASSHVNAIDAATNRVMTETNRMATSYRAGKVPTIQMLKRF